MKDIAGITKEVKNIVKENIEKAEKEKRYNDDVQPVDWDNVQKVTADFVFISKNPIKVVGSFLARFVAILVSPLLCLLGFGSCKVHGRKNLSGIKGAIITCNHVHIFDNMFVRWGTFGHKLYITVAEFNNMKGPLGALLRAAGCLPFSSCFTAMKNLVKTVEKLLQNGKLVLYYPEKAMWPGYSKPRPFIEGAFHSAVVNNVPIIPSFIVLKDKKGNRKNLKKKKKGELFILKPIYPKPELSKKENVAYLKNACYNALIELYTAQFGIPPEL